MFSRILSKWKPFPDQISYHAIYPLFEICVIYLRNRIKIFFLKSAYRIVELTLWLFLCLFIELLKETVISLDRLSLQ